MHCIAYATTDLEATDLWEDSLLGHIVESRDCTIDCQRIILTELVDVKDLVIYYCSWQLQWEDYRSKNTK